LKLLILILNDGAGKTEAMHFAASVAAAEAFTSTAAPLTLVLHHTAQGVKRRGP
jgi:hypothetical protein